MYCSHVADVAIPKDTRVYQGDDKTKWKADKLILSNIRPVEQFINELSVEDSIRLVQNSLWIFPYVKEQTPELCKIAVKQNGWALQFVKEQTPELCKLAVQQNGMALQFVKEQTPELCEITVKNDCMAFRFVKPF
ncbi:MAG: DUF4116 domain-containing protein [Verrucomicrobia bacterium]|nr:DUF4116 domain-containing protein [Verrucomicrobiota bacterium]